MGLLKTSCERNVGTFLHDYAETQYFPNPDSGMAELPS
jgi:hypothetical protein